MLLTVCKGDMCRIASVDLFHQLLWPNKKKKILEKTKISLLEEKNIEKCKSFNVSVTATDIFSSLFIPFCQHLQLL